MPVTKDKMRGFVGDGFALRHTHAPDQGGRTGERRPVET